MNKIELGKQYQTRDGREVRIYAVDAGGEYPVHGAIKDGAGWSAQQWTCDGVYSVCSLSASVINFNLIEVKPKRKIEFWVNVYKKCELACHLTKFSADEYAGDNRLACLHFTREYEEGEGL